MALRRSCHPPQLASQLSAHLTAQPASQFAAQLSALPAAQLAPQQCTQMPLNGSERPFSAICVHYCVTTGRPRDPRASTVYTNAPERRREAVFGDLCTLLRPPCVTRGRPRDPRASTVYTNAPERRRKAVFGDLCTLLRPPASPGGARVTPAPQQCTQMPQNGVERPFSAICVHYCVPLRHQGAPAS